MPVQDGTTSLKVIKIPETVVDVGQLTDLEQRVYNLSEEDWCKIEEKVMDQFTPYTYQYATW